MNEPPIVSAWHMYRSLCGVGLACGLLIVTAFEVTRPIIRQNRIEARQRAIFDVIPGAVSSAAFRATDDGFTAAGADEEGEGLLFAGYAEDGRLVGLALEAAAMGYQDTVRVIYGYAFEHAAIVGMQVLETRETPGLGDRIEIDPDFLRNFERLDVSLDESGERVAHPIEAVKPGAKEHPWQIDCISGATISSEAVADMLRDSSMRWIPRVERHRDKFRSER